MDDIKNINDLRAHAILTLKKLEKGKIDMSEAGVTAKLYESVISSLKIELEYNKMLGSDPFIPFLEDESNTKKLMSKQDNKKLLGSK